MKRNDSAEERNLLSIETPNKYLNYQQLLIVVVCLQLNNNLQHFNNKIYVTNAFKFGKRSR